MFPSKHLIMFLSKVENVLILQLTNNRKHNMLYDDNFTYICT